MVKVTTTHLSIGKSVRIKTKSIDLTYYRQVIKNINGSYDTDGNCSIRVPNLCSSSIINYGESCSSKVINQQVKI